MNDNKESYSNIFKTTFLFGFVQVFKALISIIKNKLVAILIGTEGMGLLGIFTSTIQVIQTGASLGVNQSAVRDVAEANAQEDYVRVSRIIAITNRIVLITGALGCFITLVLSNKISEWTLGDEKHTITYCILSIVVALNIINEGKQAILKGMRRVKHLAFASIIGTTISLFTAVTLYYFFGIDGIVPELIIASILALLVSQYYLKKIPHKTPKLPIKELLLEASPMVRMGIALMFVTFLQTIISFIINTYIRHKGGLTDVGLFSAGNYILTGYFAMIATALMTDYYPRIAAVNQDNVKLQDELNKQSMVTVILCCPLIVLFIILMPLFIKFLYSEEFLPALDYLKFGIYWTIITLCSNQVDMILVAKYNTKVFMKISVIVRIVQLLLCIILYDSFNLLGLGISYALLGVLHLIVMTVIVYKLYDIHFSYEFVKVALTVLIMSIIGTSISFLEHIIIKSIFGTILIIYSIIFSIYQSKRKLNIDFLYLIRRKINNV